MRSLKSMFVCAVCFVLVGFSVNASANLVTNPGFETYEITTGDYPEVFGDWMGDVSEIVSSENGITPLEGSNMLHFIYAAGDAGPSSITASNLRQTIDVSGYAGLIASGNAVANFSAYFNRVAGDAQTDTEFVIRIDAFAGLARQYETLKKNELYLAYSLEAIYSDADINTWEIAMTNLEIPVGTDFLAIQVVAIENVYNDTSHPEFDGHYCDMVSLEIVPEPATLSLLALGTVLLRRKKQPV